ncbi:Archaeal TRASH domain protein [Novipirellula galeiformis]|uniref:Archaeal TRASH domain protein n=1 Tax=Novipirellula galeiformis TaxID=2528004 RepID=A0A5C6CF60_9BACT|nr:hypothetical protein [Novipirellula galeiformis]TWU22377.1 Archaeal TRASH domain protein [Novipirellula galeiformis]
MKRNLHFALTLVAGAFATGSLSVNAQNLENHAGHSHAAHGSSAVATAEQPVQGPHGGSLRQTGGVQLETVVSQGGIQLFVYDRAGTPVAIEQGRGAASLRVEGNAKRYRYDLLPDGKGGLSSAVNLSAIAGRQIEIDVQLVGVPSTSGQAVVFKEVATVPASETQLAAAAIARQKICLVSGKPLGSMGDPIGVDINGQTVYVCCAGCVNAVKSNPAKYAAGRPEITVASATAADAALVAKQATCPVMDEPLGSMGQPVKVTIGDKPIFLCCKGCVKKIKAEPAKYLAMVYGDSAPAEESTTAGKHATASVPAQGEQVREGVFKVSPADAPYIAAQKQCPVMDEPLDAMGGPFKVNAAGKAIYICCPGCAKKIAADPAKYLAILKSQGVEAPALR